MTFLAVGAAEGALESRTYGTDVLTVAALAICMVHSWYFDEEVRILNSQML
jgi:hypothetical protein